MTKKSNLFLSITKICFQHKVRFSYSDYAISGTPRKLQIEKGLRIKFLEMISSPYQDS